MSDLLIIAGPTASGKTDLAVALAERMRLEVINGDALQVYRGLDIGTAKPSPEVRSRVRHHLIDILEPDQRFSAGEFARLARRAVADVRSRQATPVVVGGSGFYLRALVDGLAAVPPVPERVRREVAQSVEQRGVSAMWSELHAIDPEFAESVEPSDAQRVSRGLEVHRATGRPLTAWHRARPATDSDPDAEATPLAACWIGLTLPRSLLYDRIEARTARMLDAGWLREVRDLRRRYPVDAAAFQAIGYRTLVAVLEKRISLEQASKEIIRDTRRYAKRQLTWFRNEPRVHWVAPGCVDAALEVWRGENE